MMYALKGFANFSGTKNCLVVPVFAVPGQNVYYIQIMDRNYDIVGFSPYYNFDDAKMIYVDSSVSRSRGEAGILGIIFGEDQVFFDNITEVRRWGQCNESVYRDSPLLRAQMARLAVAGVGEKYLVFSETAKELFHDSGAASLWLESELVLLQKHKQIWDAVDRINRHENQWMDPIQEGQQDDFENLIGWLSSGNNIDNPNWSKVWFYTEAFVSYDERIYSIAIRWIQYLYGSGGEYIFKGSRILNRMLQRARGQRDAEFSELLVDLLVDGVLTSRDVALTTANLETALLMIADIVNEKDMAVILSRILTTQPLYEYEVTTVMEALYRSMVGDEGAGSVGAMDQKMFAAPSIVRYLDNERIHALYDWTLEIWLKRCEPAWSNELVRAPNYKPMAKRKRDEVLAQIWVPKPIRVAVAGG